MKTFEIDDSDDKTRKGILELSIRDDFNVPGIHILLYKKIYPPLQREYQDDTLTKKLIANFIGKHSQHTLVTTLNGKVIGFCMYEVKKLSINLRYLLVTPVHRRLGVASNLLNVLKTKLSHLTIDPILSYIGIEPFITLTALSEDLALFYYKQGFTPYNRTTVRGHLHIEMIYQVNTTPTNMLELLKDVFPSDYIHEHS
jgi:N-acetylglutamate synthase-like GNAT family acetyltransferase